MKRVWLRALLLTAGLMCSLAAGAYAQDVMRVYVSEQAMTAQEALHLTELLDREFPQAKFELADNSGGLRGLVLSDELPHLAVCSPREALPWARERLTLPLQRRIDDQERIAREVLFSCVYEENLFMAPLMARHRQMAVNVELLEEQGLGFMLDEIAHPVWYPTEFQQILEEFAIAGRPAMDIWRPQPQSSAALEALIQAIYSGSLLGGDGETCTADSAQIRAGVRWLRDLIEGEMIGYCQERQHAIDRFAAGETAILIDWTQGLQEKYAQELEASGMQIETRPYPSSSGMPVRAYEVVGVSAFDSGDTLLNALSMQAAAFLHEDQAVQMLLGERAIYEDDSIWLWDLTANDRGATLRSLLCRALGQVFEEERDVGEAFALVSAGMETAK